MAALTKIRSTDRKGPCDRLARPVKAATKCFGGGIAVGDAGYAAPGRTATGLIALGIFLDDYDNLAGAAGAKTAEIETGVPFRLGNSAAGDLIAQGDAGTVCYIVDDQTVAKTNGGSTRSEAGIVDSVDADGSVWVRVGVKSTQ